MSSQLIRFLLNFASMIVLARVLRPQDFGLIAMVTSITGVAVLLRDFGLGSALIYAKKLSPAQVSSVFWINAALAGMLACAVVLFAPAISAFYDEPALTAVTRVLAIGFFLAGLATVHLALLARQMLFGRLFRIEIASAIVATSVGIVAALRGLDYWSLVLMALGETVTRLILTWTATRWRPGLPRRHSGVRALLGYGGNLFGFQLLNYLGRNADNILIGRFAGPVELGFYARAYQMLLLPLQQINAPIRRVALPILSALQDDPSRYRRFLGIALRLVAYTTCTMFLIAGALSEPLVRVVLGGKWTPAASIFEVLAFAGVAQALGYVTSFIYQSTGATGRQLIYAAVTRPIVIASFVVGLPFGAYGVALSHTIVSLALVIPSFANAIRGTEVRLGDILRAIYRPLVLGMLLYVCVKFADHLVASLPDLGRLAIGGLIASTVWLLCFSCSRSIRREVLEVWDLLQSNRRGSD